MQQKSVFLQIFFTVCGTYEPESRLCFEAFRRGKQFVTAKDGDGEGNIGIFGVLSGFQL